ncbi:hypothetical protein AZO1586I_1554 [Bathymodiolus thermophilus thioautotrophic gill symbiont]|uniref:Uncharacterized protein n=1 Tax=Bathymodiolus thermophilus thioautotrophic gill symbiont TaxID=2360 RepID=A0ABM8MBC2_9GAMM|nr:hypothetical protein AZO1586I_1554 [Bathymodiolus thermophilus thioautotrophic gill symbiont]
MLYFSQLPNLVINVIAIVISIAIAIVIKDFFK